MELRQVRYFAAVADERSFTRAARRLGVSQPPLSFQIRKLEEELGARLFDRSSQKVELTAAGAAFQIGARRILDEVQKSRDAVRDAASGLVGTLHVGFIASASYELVPNLVRRVAKAMPKVGIRLYDTTNERQIEMLRRGELDAGFRPTACRGARYRLRDCPPRTVLCRRAIGFGARQARTVRLAELREHAFIVSPRRLAPAYFDLFIRACNRGGVQPPDRSRAGEGADDPRYRRRRSRDRISPRIGPAYPLAGPGVHPAIRPQGARRDRVRAFRDAARPTAREAGCRQVIDTESIS